MPRAVRFGNNDGRVDRSGLGERARLAGQLSEGQEAHYNTERDRSGTAPRSSRDVEPTNVRFGFLIGFVHVLNHGDYSPDELAKDFQDLAALRFIVRSNDSQRASR